MTRINTLLCILLGFTAHCVVIGHNKNVRKSVQKMSVKELSIRSSVSIRYAKVLVRSLVENPDTRDDEISFQVRIPQEAFITNFSIITNEKTINAVIKDKFAAAEDYDKAKEEGVSAGTVTQQTNVADDIDRNIFNVKVNVPAQTTLELQLRYEELILKNAGKYSHKLYIDADHIIPQMEVQWEVKEKLKFKHLTYQTPIDVEKVFLENEELTDDGYFKRKLDWKPTETEQSLATSGFEKPFEIEYELDSPENGGLVYENGNGEFVHLFSTACDEINIMMKQIVFVIDISGSMKNDPIMQVRQTMFDILSLLRFYDYFNIILFNERATMWSGGFRQATLLNIRNAKEFVQEKVIAKGSTNINDAILKAVNLFSDGPEYVKDERLGQIVFFLTDGDPTVGVTNENKIRSNVRESNYYEGITCCKSSIYTIAFGRNAAIGFLRALANENEGFIRIIRETDTEGEILDLYHGVENPYLKDVEFNFKVDNEDIPEENVTQRQFRQYDCGNELVVAGFTYPGAKLYPSVKASSINDTVNYEGIKVVRADTIDADTITRLLAYKRVKQLLKEIELENDKTRLKLIKNKALNLSLQYGFVTPLTSLVVSDLHKKEIKEVDAGSNIKQNRAGTGSGISQQWNAFNNVQYDSADSFYDDINKGSPRKENITSSANVLGIKYSMYLIMSVYVLSVSF